jgi:hypothetical protein
MPGIFLSYRRADGAGTAGRLADRLSQHFGAQAVFRDIESIEAGENFEDAIGNAVRAAAVVLIVIGPRWLELNAHGKRRIDDPDDYVRREVELAMAVGAPVIPVLVEGARPPSAERLPPSIRTLAKLNAVELTHERWDRDVGDLLRLIERRGVPAAKTAALDERGRRRPAHDALLAGIVEYVPNLLALLRAPHRFLARAAQPGAANLTRALVFFTLTVLIAVAILVTAYTPARSVPGFALAVLVAGLTGTIVLSLALWLVWRAVGARDHCARVLVLALHQMAVLHLVVLVIAWMVVLGMDFGSLHAMRDAIAEAMQAGRAAGAAVDIIGKRLEPLAQAPSVRVAFVLAALVLASGTVWAVWSWRAYRDAFGLSRARSAAAFLLLIVMAGAAIGLITVSARLLR